MEGDRWRGVKRRGGSAREGGGTAKCRAADERVPTHTFDTYIPTHTYRHIHTFDTYMYLTHRYIQKIHTCVNSPHNTCIQRMHACDIR